MRYSSSMLQVMPLFFLIVLDGMGAGIVLTILPTLFMSTHYGLVTEATSSLYRYILFGASLAVFPFFLILSSPLLGALSDRGGRKRLLITCSSAVFICYMILAYSVIIKSLSLFFLGRCLAGCVAGNQPIAQAALLDVSSKDSKFKNLTLVSVAGSLGVIIGPLVGGTASLNGFMNKFGLSTPFFFAGILSIISIIMLAVLYRGGSKPAKGNRYSLRVQIMGFLNDKSLYSIASVLFLGQICWGLLFQAFVLRLKIQFNFQPHQTALFLAYIGVFIAIGGIVAVKFIYKKSVENILLFTLGLLTVSSLLSGVINSEILQWLFIGVAAVAAVIFNGAALYVFTKNSSVEERGLLMGLALSVIYIASIISSFLSGITNYYSYHLPGILCFFVGGFAFILACKLKFKVSKGKCLMDV